MRFQFQSAFPAVVEESFFDGEARRASFSSFFFFRAAVVVAVVVVVSLFRGERRREYDEEILSRRVSGGVFQQNEERLDGKNGQERKFRERQRESERSVREKSTKRRVDINAETIERAGGLLRGTRSAEMVAKSGDGERAVDVATAVVHRADDGVHAPSFSIFVSIAL